MGGPPDPPSGDGAQGGDPAPAPAPGPATVPAIPATALRRLAAFLVDALPVAAFHLTVGRERWIFTALFFALYHTVSVAAWGAPLGKAMLGLEVRGADGKRLRWGRAFLRCTLGYASSALLLLGFLRALLDPRGHAWHDRLYGSEVVQQPGPLTLKGVLRALDRWSDEVDRWQRNLLARHSRLKSLVGFVAKITLVLEFVQGVVTKLLKPAFGGTSAASGAAAASTGTGIVLATATGILVQAVLPAAAPPYAGVVEAALDRHFGRPTAVAVSAGGATYLAVPDLHRIRRHGADRVWTTVAGSARAVEEGQYAGGFAGDGGRAEQALLNRPLDVAIGRDGHLYVADAGNGRIRRVAPDGTITTVAGGGAAEPRDGAAATDTKLAFPMAVACGPDGDVYIAETGKHRVLVLERGGTLRVVAGTGEPGLSGDGGTASGAKLQWPDGVAVAADGVLFVADTGNGRIRRVEEGRITTLADYGGDRPVMDFPTALVALPDGGVLMTDRVRCVVRRVDRDGNASVVAGGSEAADDEGVPATRVWLSAPAGLARAGETLFLVEQGTRCLRRIAPDGIITTVVAQPREGAGARR